MTPIKQAYPLAQLSLLKKMICPPAGENTSGDVPHQALSLTGEMATTETWGNLIGAL
jgi:hypothetical protein